MESVCIVKSVGYRDMCVYTTDKTELTVNRPFGTDVGDIIFGRINGNSVEIDLIIVDRSNRAVIAKMSNAMRKSGITMAKQLSGNNIDYELTVLAFAKSKEPHIKEWRRIFPHRFNVLGIKTCDIITVWRHLTNNAVVDIFHLYDRILTRPYTVFDLDMKVADNITQLYGIIDPVARFWMFVAKVLYYAYNEISWTYIPLDEFGRIASTYIPLEYGKYTNFLLLIKEHADKQDFIIVTDTYVRLAYLDVIEKYIANVILASKMDTLPNYIDDFESALDFKFQPSQRRAFEYILNNNVTFVNGEAGTGKTTFIQMVYKYIEMYTNLPVCCVSFTGKAARRMEEGHNGVPLAMTIHSFVARYDRTKPFVLFIDEISMVSTELLHMLFTNITCINQCRIIFVGDKEQLPPINQSSFIHAYLKANMPTMTLCENMRSGETILKNAHAILTGSSMISDESFEIKQMDIAGLQRWISANVDFVRDACVLSPYNKVCDKLNVFMRTKIQGVSTDELVVNDLVVHTKNYYSSDYDLIYNENDRLIDVTGYRIANGEIGKIDGLGLGYVKVKISGRTFKYTISKSKTVASDDLFEETVGELGTNILKHRYAMTVHKSQGSEYDNGIIFVPKGACPILTRNLLYTAITRFKKKVKLFGDLPTIQVMISTLQPVPFELLSVSLGLRP